MNEFEKMKDNKDYVLEGNDKKKKNKRQKK